MPELPTCDPQRSDSNDLIHLLAYSALGLLSGEKLFLWPDNITDLMCKKGSHYIHGERYICS
jgi:hypothetical protein